jgi:hypothetical protein
MKRRRAVAAGGLGVALAIIVVISLTAASGGTGSAGGLHFGRSLERARARNLRLQSMIALLTERQIQGSESLAPDEPPAQVVAPPVESKPASETSSAESSECDPNYEGACLDPNASDYDCEGGSGDGPDYTGEVIVVGEDHFGLDADGDGIGCEAE